MTFDFLLLYGSVERGRTMVQRRFGPTMLADVSTWFSMFQTNHSVLFNVGASRKAFFALSPARMLRNFITGNRSLARWNICSV